MEEPVTDSPIIFVEDLPYILPSKYKYGSLV